MDGSHFNTLAKTFFAAAGSRRQALGGCSSPPCGAFRCKRILLRREFHVDRDREGFQDMTRGRSR
jgi:hypothetical protein